MEDISKVVEEIKSEFLKINIKVPHSVIEEQMNLFCLDYKVPISDAKSSVINYFLKEYNVDKLKFFGVNITKLKDLSDKDWVTVKAKVVQLWKKSHESISQVGLIGDETGIVKFTKWKQSNIPNIEVGKVYEFNNVVVSEWNEKLQITINKNSVVKEIDEEITPKTTPKNTTNFKGALLHIQPGSGLIKRCLECNRALNRGVCSIHGYSDGKYDLRIKAVLDNGKTTYDCIINKELTEKISNISIDDAIKLASKTLDMSVVLEQIKQIICGRYYSVTGYMLDGKIIAESIEQILNLGKYNSSSDTLNENQRFSRKYNSSSDTLNENTTGVNEYLNESVNVYAKEHVSEYVKEHQREVAKRIFSFEFNVSDKILKKGTGQYAKGYLQTPTGLEINRLFLVGALIEKRKINADFDFWQGKVSDPFGTFQISAGKYQPHAIKVLSECTIPCFLAVIGKPSVYKRNDGTIDTFINAEFLYVVDRVTRDQWILETAHRTIERIESQRCAEESEKRTTFVNLDDYLVKAHYAIDSIK